MTEFKSLDEQMTAGEYLVQLLEAVLNEHKAPPAPEGLTCRQVYETAKLHSLEAMTFYGASELCKDSPEFYRFWQEQKNRLLIQGITQLAEQKEIIHALTIAGIRVLPLKGHRIQRLYRQIDFRQMSDLDFLIDEKNMEQAKAVMRELGYEGEAPSAEHHEEFRKPPYVEVELHRHLLPEDDRNFLYYSDIWKKAIPDKEEKGCFRLTAEDEYIYYMAHFFKHYKSFGGGIRSLLDIYVYTEQLGNSMDRSYIHSQFDRMGLSDFAEKAEKLSRVWFHADRAVQKREAWMNETEKNLFCGGAFGSRIGQFYRTVGDKRDIGKKITYFLSRIFMNKKDFKQSYPILRKWPVLLPFCWIHRFFYILIFKRDALLTEVEWMSVNKKK